MGDRVPEEGEAPVSFGDTASASVTESIVILDEHGAALGDRLASWPSYQPRAVPKARGLRLLSTATKLISEMVEHTPTLDLGQEPEPEHEVGRLVVLRGAPGSIAFGAPWQLHPLLRDKDCTVVASHPQGDLVLEVREGDAVTTTWRVPASDIARAEVREPGGRTPGLRVHFTDGSWLRLDSTWWQRLTDMAPLLGS